MDELGNLCEQKAIDRANSNGRQDLLWRERGFDSVRILVDGVLRAEILSAAGGVVRRKFKCRARVT